MGRGTGGPNAPSLYGDGRWRHPRMCPDHVARGQGRGCGLQVVLARDGGGRRIDRTLGQRPRDNRRRRGNVKTQREGERRERERFPSHYNVSLSRPPTPSCRPPHTSSPGQQPNASAVGSRGAMRREAGTSETGTAGDHCFLACDRLHPSLLLKCLCFFDGFFTPTRAHRMRTPRLLALFPAYSTTAGRSRGWGEMGGLPIKGSGGKMKLFTGHTRTANPPQNKIKSRIPPCAHWWHTVCWTGPGYRGQGQRKGSGGGGGADEVGRRSSPPTPSNPSHTHVRLGCASSSAVWFPGTEGVRGLPATHLGGGRGQGKSAITGIT